MKTEKFVLRGNFWSSLKNVRQAMIADRKAITKKITIL